MLRAPENLSAGRGGVGNGSGQVCTHLPPCLEAGGPKKFPRFLGPSPYLLDGSVPKHGEKTLAGHQVIHLVPSWEVGHGPLSSARYLLGRENRLWESPGRPACGRQAPVTSAYPHRCLDQFPLAKAPSLTGHHLLPCTLGHMAPTGSNPGRTQGLRPSLPSVPRWMRHGPSGMLGAPAGLHSAAFGLGKAWRTLGRRIKAAFPALLLYPSPRLSPFPECTPSPCLPYLCAICPLLGDTG